MDGTIAWTSGFLPHRPETGMPVTLGFIDRTTMTTGLGPTFDLTGDDKAGVRPDRTTEPRLREESPAVTPGP